MYPALFKKEMAVKLSLFCSQVCDAEAAAGGGAGQTASFQRNVRASGD